jgi:TusA-related sulfurtransferase
MSVAVPVAVTEGHPTDGVRGDGMLGPMPEPLLDPDAFYDAGDQGCAGPALREINAILEGLTPGQTLEVRSEDATGRENFRAYCRLRGYSIEREEERSDGDRLLVRK